MTHSNNIRVLHFAAISLIPAVLLLSLLVTLATAADGQSSNAVDSEHHQHWPDVRTAANTLLSIFLVVLSAAKTIASKSTFIALSPLRFSWRATKWVTLAVWSSTMEFVSIPIVTYILIAVGCGAVIGGCAGFAVELLTTLLHSATWGKKVTPSATPADAGGNEHEAEDALHDENSSSRKNNDSCKDEEGDDDGQIRSDAMLELLQQHLANFAKEQSICHQETSASTSTLLEATA